MKSTLLIVDDDEEIRSQMKWALADEYDLLVAGDRGGALELARQARPPVALLDLGLPPHPTETDEGFATLAELLAHDRQMKIIVVTGQGEKDNALRAVGEGAYDFLSKPVDMDELRIILKRAAFGAQLEREYRELQRYLNTETFEGMLGGSARMQSVFNTIRKVATTDAPVLILGESGTGKEVAALAVHRQSPRRDGPFIPINCGAIPETLLESELFGHEKGAFTGAHMMRKGRIESAAAGTLFLDEIGELPLALQVKLLRFLQDSFIQRVGGRQTIAVDTRVIAATNVDLKRAQTEGKFREDLYYRLAVVNLALPPLRERPEDIPILAKSFLKKFAPPSGASPGTFAPAALRALQQYPWPGNVRELENRIKRAIIMAEGRQVTSPDLELSDAPAAARVRTLKDAREAAEREVILAALQRHKWKIAPTAVELDISRPTLYELMEKLGIQKPEASSEGSSSPPRPPE
ncbi:MAG: PEP-CTERM-box response regulator transcription factor [Verrucomicrobia bacterium]|nr:PEP-CTERM-box response regulator transcription factor [Verrucomicrobiota bacterium]